MATASPLRVLLDARLLAWTASWSVVAGLAFGLVSAIIANPVFARSVPPDAAAIGIWLVSAPLMGLVMATYTAPARPSATLAAVSLAPADALVVERRSTRLGGLAGFGAFLAIGCPVCNKVALVLLGASGAMSVWAPIQPVVGAISLVLLVVTAAWRLRLRASGGACTV